MRFPFFALLCACLLASAPHAAAQTADLSDFQGDTANTAAQIKKLMRDFHLSSFGMNISRALDGGDAAGAEKLLSSRAEQNPETKDNVAYQMYESRIAFLRGDYAAAYRLADAAIARVSRCFLPGKPRKLGDAKTDAYVSSLFIYRYQAAAWLKNYPQALADLDSAMAIRPSTELMRARTFTLINLKEYEKASSAADELYAADPGALAKSKLAPVYCARLQQNGFTPRACAQLAQSQPVGVSTAAAAAL
jgi:tetratricopeptide (TPR) repeat protein